MQTLGELIERNARHCPRDEVFIAEERSLSYLEYAQRSRCLASALHGLGLQRQDRVAIFSSNNLEYLEVAGACGWSGLCAALFNFRLAGPEVEWLIQDSAPKVLFFEAQFTSLIDSLRHRFPELLHYVCIGGVAPEWAVSFEALMEQGDEAGPPFRAEASDLVFIFFTSGTTGKPKGVPYDQAGALSIFQNQGRQRGQQACILQITPLFHTGGMFIAMPCMWLAGKAVLLPAFDPLQVLESVQRHRVTFAFMVAPMIEAIIDHPRFSEFELSSLREVMSASAPIALPLLSRAIAAFGPVFFIAYGSTEAGTVCNLNRNELRPDGTPDEVARLASVGHFDPEVDALILDDEGRPCKPGQVGEVCVRLPHFRGYWNNSVATVEALRHGYFRTGDMAYQDDEGFVFIVDRKKDMIISGGENIYSREVEDALVHHQAVKEAAVVGVADAKWGESVKAFVVLRSGQAIDEDNLIALCKTRIARYKCPRRIEFVADLPRLGTGKIDKLTLRRHGLPSA